MSQSIFLSENTHSLTSKHTRARPTNQIGLRHVKLIHIYKYLEKKMGEAEAYVARFVTVFVLFSMSSTATRLSPHDLIET